MTKFRLVLVVLCLGILGALPFIISMPKSSSADTHQASLSQTRPEIGVTLQQAVRLSEANNYNGALKLVDGLSAVPDKTNLEVQQINQVRDYVLIKQSHP